MMTKIETFLNYDALFMNTILLFCIVKIEFITKVYDINWL